MTPKQKAIELVDKYRGLVISAPYTDSEDGSCIGETMMLTRSAKQCALIVVDELIKATEDVWFLDGNYWQQVKHEIEKI